VAARERRRVHERLAAADERRDAALELCEVALRVLVDEPDRRAGENVVELLEEEQLPEPIELGARVRAAARDREELGVVQPELRAAVALLHERLRRVGPAVVLEVQLADDDRALDVLRLERVEELVGARRAHARQALQVARATDALEHVARRSAAAVAVTEDEEADIRLLGVPVLVRRLQ